jgi:hypothetical protein
MQNVALATVYPGGMWAIVFYAVAFFLFVVSGISALLAVAFVPFSRTARIAGVLASIGIRGGTAALALLLTSTVFIAFDSGLKFGSSDFKKQVGDASVLIPFVAIVPLFGVGVRHFGRRLQNQKRL